MPVFFYIDPEFAEDPRMVNVDLITLSYTFFEAKEGHKLPIPGYNWSQQLSSTSFVIFEKSCILSSQKRNVLQYNPFYLMPSILNIM